MKYENKIKAPYSGTAPSPPVYESRGYHLVFIPRGGLSVGTVIGGKSGYSAMRIIVNALQEVTVRGGNPTSVAISAVDELNLQKDTELCRDHTKSASQQLPTIGGVPVWYGQSQTGTVFTDANGRQQFRPFAL